ncbi:MAG: hypothetical protein ACUZ77_02120, partial [Candidatus Brocadiales bacterium]
MKNYYKILTSSIALVLVSVLFLELNALAITLPFAKGEHLIILITAADIPALAAKVDEPSDPLYQRYIWMKNDVDTAINNSTLGPYNMTYVAFVYLIENYLHPDDSAKYLNAVKQVLENDNLSNHTLYGGRNSFALVYDWIYNGLSPQDRIALGNKMVTTHIAIQWDINDPNRYMDNW